jgi:hypothetical protein
LYENTLLLHISILSLYIVIITDYEGGLGWSIALLATARSWDAKGGTGVEYFRTKLRPDPGVGDHTKNLK